MHISSRSLALAFAALAAAAPSALASADQSVSPGEATSKASWTSPVGSGVNTSFFLDSFTKGGKCGAVSDPQTACDQTVVHVTGNLGVDSTLTFRIDGFLPTSDFDIRVYEADEDGTPEAYLGSPTSTDNDETSPLGSNDPRHTGAGDYENKVVAVGNYADPETGDIDQKFVVMVPYFLVLNDSYKGHATLTATEFVAPADEE